MLEFLQDVDPNIEYNVVPISDPFGPTKDDPTFEVCTYLPVFLKSIILSCIPNY